MLAHLKAADTLVLPLPAAPNRLADVAASLRVHYWAKNLLLFVPLLCSHRMLDSIAGLRAWTAFVAFCLCASGGYLLNDVLDLDLDRTHPTKRNRPIAAGRISVKTAGALAASLIVLGLATVATLGAHPLEFLLLYVALATAYSVKLKRLPLFDVITLAALHGIRVLAGSAATGLALSEWLVGSTVFFFLSLALLKRYQELGTTAAAVTGRGYVRADRYQLMMMGQVNAAASVLLLALYIRSPETMALYRSPEVLWFLCPALLVWISRMWLQMGRGMFEPDLVARVLSDKATYVTIAIAAVTLSVASAGW